MIRSTDEMLQEVRQRTEKIKNKRRHQQISMLSGVLTVLVVGLIGVIASFSRVGAAGQTSSVYGAFLISTSTGGYILVAILAFAAGIIITKLIQKYLEGRNGPEA